MYITFVIVGFIIFLIIFLLLISPKNYHVFRTLELDHPKTKVWEHITFLQRQQEWSPWASKDPNMVQKIIGTDGEVGAISSWSGNKEVGEGEQEITKIVHGKRIEQDLRFLKPFKSESKCYIELDDINTKKSKVTWGFSGDTKFPMNIMVLFMSMDKMIGKDFEKGLQNLKNNLNSNV